MTNPCICGHEKEKHYFATMEGVSACRGCEAVIHCTYFRPAEKINDDVAEIIASGTAEEIDSKVFGVTPPAEPSPEKPNMTLEQKIQHIRENKYRGKIHSRFKHGLWGTPIYKKWEAMKRRCLSVDDDSFRRYGGRGIRVCRSWLSFQAFYKDMGPSFRAGFSLDRINNKKGYSPKNCRWVSMADQAKNKSNVHRFLWKGKLMTIRELAESVDMNPRALYPRLVRYKWPLEKALTIPVNLGNKYKIHTPQPYGKVA